MGIAAIVNTNDRGLRIKQIEKLSRAVAHTAKEARILVVKWGEASQTPLFATAPTIDQEVIILRKQTYLSGRWRLPDGASMDVFIVQAETSFF